MNIQPKPFSLSIVCQNEYLDCTHLLIPKLQRLMSNKKEVSVFINGDVGKVMLPFINPQLDKFIINRNYQLKIITDFTDNPYDELLKSVIQKNGDGLILFGNEPFKKYCIERFMICLKELPRPIQQTIADNTKIKFIDVNELLHNKMIYQNLFNY